MGSMNKLYERIIKKYGFDKLGVFDSYYETGLERVVWNIIDERAEWPDSLIVVDDEDKILLLDRKGNKIRGPVELSYDDVTWASFFSMCSKLKINPGDAYEQKFMVGLYYNRWPDFRNIMPDLDSYIFNVSNSLWSKTAEVKKSLRIWFYSKNEFFNGETPLEVYKSGFKNKVIDYLIRADVSDIMNAHRPQ